MASGWKFRHDSAGVRRILQTAFNDDLDKAARDIAASAEVGLDAAGHGEIPVLTDSHTSDRHSATVSVASALGLPLEARHGILNRAAAEHGYTVKDPK